MKYNYEQNININANIDRNKYVNELPSGGRGDWQHNPEHRKGVSYRDQGTAQKFNRASTNQAIKSRESFRGRTEQGPQNLSRAGAGDRSGATQLDGSGARGGAFEGIGKGGNSARTASARGSASRSSSSTGGRAAADARGGGFGRGK